MDGVAWFIVTAHSLLGHAGTAAVIGADPGDASACLICAYEHAPTDERMRAVEQALAPGRTEKP